MICGAVSASLGERKERGSMSGESPFAGFRRKRLPGMRWQEAQWGGMSLKDAMTSYMFEVLHSRLRHACLVRDALNAPGSLQVDRDHLVREEWSYLEDEVLVASIEEAARVFVDQVQFWVATGLEKPSGMGPDAPFLATTEMGKMLSGNFETLSRAGGYADGRARVAALRQEINASTITPI